MVTFISKHLLVAILIATLYSVVARNFGGITQIETLNTLLLFVGLIIVAPMFAFFQFSYQFTEAKPFMLLISHLTTGAALFVIGILLVMIDVLFLRLVGDILIFRITLFIYYLTCIGYDTWDYARFKAPKAAEKWL